MPEAPTPPPATEAPSKTQRLIESGREKRGGFIKALRERATAAKNKTADILTSGGRKAEVGSALAVGFAADTDTRNEILGDVAKAANEQRLNAMKGAADTLDALAKNTDEVIIGPTKAGAEKVAKTVVTAAEQTAKATVDAAVATGRFTKDAAIVTGAVAAAPVVGAAYLGYKAGEAGMAGVGAVASGIQTTGDAALGGIKKFEDANVVGKATDAATDRFFAYSDRGVDAAGNAIKTGATATRDAAVAIGTGAQTAYGDLKTNVGEMATDLGNTAQAGLNKAGEVGGAVIGAARETGSNIGTNFQEVVGIPTVEMAQAAGTAIGAVGVATKEGAVNATLATGRGIDTVVSKAAEGVNYGVNQGADNVARGAADALKAGYGKTMDASGRISDALGTGMDTMGAYGARATEATGQAIGTAAVAGKEAVVGGVVAGKEATIAAAQEAVRKAHDIKEKITGFFRRKSKETTAVVKVGQAEVVGDMAKLLYSTEQTINRWKIEIGGRLLSSGAEGTIKATARLTKGLEEKQMAENLRSQGGGNTAA